MKPVDIDLEKAKKGLATPRAIALDLLDAIENGKIKHIVYVVQTNDDLINMSWNDGLPHTQAIGLLASAQMDINEHMKG